MNILQTMTDPQLFGAAFRPAADGVDTWKAWRAFLGCLFGLELPADQVELVRQHTGRTDLPGAPFTEASLVIGRRGGKSRILSLIGLYLACFIDHSGKLAPGERGVVAIVAADRRQARNILAFTMGLLRSVPALAELIVGETQDSVSLSNGIVIEVYSASFRLTRGTSLVAALMDELAFFRDATSANPDTEIVAALRPGLANLGGLLLLASSPYARRGALWDSYKLNYGQPGARVLCWKASTLEMNPALPASIVAAAYEADPASAAAEFGGEFRIDIAQFVDRQVVEAAVVPDRFELPCISGVSYSAFCDPSGGSSDSYTIAISHQERGLGVLDAVRERRPPFSPEAVTIEYAELLKTYGIRQVTGDRYAGEFPRELFFKQNITYSLSDRPKSDIYRDTLPLLNSGKMELLDNRVLISQLCGLERRTARGGRDSIDHAPGAKDDVINAAMGALLAVSTRPDKASLWAMQAPA